MNREFIHTTLASSVPSEQQVAITRVAEEASELTKEAMKALRFGLENRYPKDGPTNAEKMVAEFSDVRDALVDAGVLPSAREILREFGALLFQATYRVCAEAEGFYRNGVGEPDWHLAKGQQETVNDAIDQYFRQRAKP